MTIATGILVMVALTVVGTLLAAVAYAIMARGRDWLRELLSVRVLPFLFMGLAVGATTFGIGFAAKDAAEEALQLAVDDIEADCDDQLSLLLHANATDFAYKYAATNNLTHAEIQRLCEYCCIDEFTIVDSNGRIVDTTDPGTKAGALFFTDEKVHSPYRALLNGQRSTIRQRFRPSATSPDRVMKYFAMAIPGGRFLQIGYLWTSFEREWTRYFQPIFETRLIGKSGFCVVLDDQNIIDAPILGHPDSKGKRAAEIGFTPENLSVPLGQIFRARLFGTLYRCLAYPETIANRRIIAVVPLSEGQGAALALAGGVAFVLLAAFLVFRLILRKFRLQQAKIDALHREEEERRAADLALARAIQRAELRTDGTTGDGYRITPLMNAAREVGGDFYDYYELPDGRLVLTIADVSGKGVPAAFFMMKARMTLKSCVYSSASLTEAVAKANVRLARNNPAEMFVTAWVGVYDRKTGALDYVSAGHNPPLVSRAVATDGGGRGATALPNARAGRDVPAVEWLGAPHCAALGVFEMAKYRGVQITLNAGDRLFLYTDGVTEAMNRAGELFGNERLEATLKGALSESASSGGLVPIVREAVATFVSGAEQSDDITMMEICVERT